MNTQFHTPSFGDEVIFDLNEINTDSATATTNHNFFHENQQQQQSKRMRSMDQSIDEYHNAASGDDSHGTNTSILIGNPTMSGTTTTAAARKQMTPIDPNEPAKPLSAYALFFRDTMSAIKQQNPNCAFQELSRIVASMWEALDPSHKNVYNKKNEMAREEYIKQMRLYRHQQMVELQQQQQTQQLLNNDLSSNAMIQSKPAVFTITRYNSENTTSDGTTINNNQVLASPQQQQQQYTTSMQQSQNQQQQLYSTTTGQEQNVNTNSAVAVSAAATSIPMNNSNSAVSNITSSNDPSPEQIQMLTEAGSVQKCTRENCNKRAIINPDWEDEYCSNECVVIHCRNVFNTWVQSNLEARKQ